MDTNELKISLLKERIGLLVADYEGAIADLRAYAAELVEKNRQLELTVQELRPQDATVEEVAE